MVLDLLRILQVLLIWFLSCHNIQKLPILFPFHPFLTWLGQDEKVITHGFFICDK